MIACARGTLVYVMGPSGAGKDSLIAYARRYVAELQHVAFAHRYITRPAIAGGENHIELSRAEFAVRRQAGCFALEWHTHGNEYGLGREIDLWLDTGLCVVANGSRVHFAAAVKRYPNLLPVLVRVDPILLQQRLRHRGREDGQMRSQRLRQAEVATVHHPSLVVVDNSGPLPEAGEVLVNLLRSLAPPLATETAAPIHEGVIGSALS